MALMERIAILWAALVLAVNCQNSSSGFQYVDPLIGTVNGGKMG